MKILYMEKMSDSIKKVIIRDRLTDSHAKSFDDTSLYLIVVKSFSVPTEWIVNQVTYTCSGKLQSQIEMNEIGFKDRQTFFGIYYRLNIPYNTSIS